MNNWDVDVFSFNIIVNKYSCVCEFWIKEWWIESDFLEKYKNYFKEEYQDYFRVVNQNHRTEWITDGGRNRSKTIYKHLIKTYEFSIELNNDGKEYDKFGLQIINDGFVKSKKIGFDYKDLKYFEECGFKKNKIKISFKQLNRKGIDSSTLNKYFK